jgi:hypothetical protein
MRLMIVVLVLAACSKDGGGGGASSGRDGLVDTWKKGGLTVSPFTAAKTQVGDDCQSGTVNGVDVLVCSFKSEADAKTAEPKGLQWVGDTTGVAQARGSLVIAIADRRKADPSGRTMNQMMKLAK